MTKISVKIFFSIKPPYNTDPLRCYIFQPGVHPLLSNNLVRVKPRATVRSYQNPAFADLAGNVRHRIPF